MEVAGSSNIASAGWCSERNCVDICFSNGAIYRYRDVSAKVWEDFKAAESKGQFVHRELKKYECEKLDPEGETETQEETEE
jgi:hypothetical protein